MTAAPLSWARTRMAGELTTRRRVLCVHLHSHWTERVFGVRTTVGLMTDEPDVLVQGMEASPTQGFSLPGASYFAAKSAIELNLNS